MSPLEFDLVRLRQGLYRFFAVGLLPPDRLRLDELDGAAELLDALGVGSLAFARPWDVMRGELATRPQVAQLEPLYVQLFESGSDGALCPPIESFYVASPRHGGPAAVIADLEVEFQREDEDDE